jgi:hypothetical protein
MVLTQLATHHPAANAQPAATDKSHQPGVHLVGLDLLRTKRERVQARKIIYERAYRIALFMVYALIVIGGMWAAFDYLLGRPYFIAPIVMFSAAALVMACSLTILSAQVRKLEENEESLEFEIDLQRFQVSDRELRAEKILWIHQSQLRRYYDLNLRQNKWVLAFGLACIALGSVLVCGTLFLVLKHAKGLEDKVVIGCIGAAGSFLTNYVATMYLKMHAATTNDLGTFHGRLVATNQILLGNLIASRIVDEQKRQDTLSQLALKISDTQSLSKTA